LSLSKPGEELYLYLAMSPYAVSSALIREEEKVKKPIYYTSKALRGAEGRHPPIEKLAFSLVTTVRKLTSTPLLSPSKPGEELYLYLAVSPHTVSSALIREEGKV